MKSFSLWLICMLLLSQIALPFQIQISLPIPTDIIVKLNLSLKKLAQALQEFDTPKMNSAVLYQRTILTDQYLKQMRTALNKFNNVLVGSNINVTGDKNIVIGSYDDIQGNNNWVFAPNFKGNITGDLVLDQWKIQMDKKQIILINPNLVISFIDQKKNQEFAKKLTSSIKQPQRIAFVPPINLAKPGDTKRQRRTNNHARFSKDEKYGDNKKDHKIVKDQRHYKNNEHKNGDRKSKR